MTREEAVNVFRNIVPIESNEEYAKNITEAISMAIEALQREDRFLKSMDTNEPLYTEVVRCKDCEYKSLYDDYDTKYYYCALEDRPNRNWSVDDTDYCSWGERKGGDSE